MYVDDELQTRMRELREAIPRPARSRHIVKYQGRGWTDVELSLGLYFLEEPTFSWGVRIVDDRAPSSMQPIAVVRSLSSPDKEGSFINQAVVSLCANSTQDRYLRFSLTFEGVAMRGTHLMFREQDD